MKIAFVTVGCFDRHPTLKRATGMAEPLIDAGHEVHLLLEDEPANQKKVASECPNAVVHWHACVDSPWAERSSKQYTLSQIQPDVVWICGVGLRNWMRKPVDETVLLADHSELYSQVHSGLIRRSVYNLLEWAHCFAFDGHICASRYLERFYRNRLKWIGKESSKVHYSPYANHPGVIRQDLDGAAAILARFPGKKVILYLGSFWSNYGFWDMLEAFRRLALKRSDFVAVLAGRGPEKESGIAWIDEKGLSEVVILEGYVPEESISAYFSAAHGFLSPLRDTVQDWARCPSKLYMYLPFRKPVITCPIGEAKELFGDRGVYYNPGDIDALTQAINDVLDQDNPYCAADPSAHTYKARTEAFLGWFESTFAR